MHFRFSLLALFIFYSSFLSAQTDTIRVLIVTAHPDDESAFAATVYKITHELHGVVDLAVLTNGEGGYKYSLLAEPYYNLKLTDEAVGRKYLPTIRKKELMSAGNIIGIGNYFFFDQKDDHYTLDMDTVMKDIWDMSVIRSRLRYILETGKYDFVLGLLPTPETHGHHKAAAVIALQAVSELKTKKPVVLGASTSNKSDTVPSVFNMLDKFPVTKTISPQASYTVDRTVSFGYRDKLNYKIIVNWEIAEQKSQGTLQSGFLSDYENFWYYEVNGVEGKKKTEELFRRLNNSHP